MKSLTYVDFGKRVGRKEKNKLFAHRQAEKDMG